MCICMYMCTCVSEYVCISVYDCSYLHMHACVHVLTKEEMDIKQDKPALWPCVVHLQPQLQRAFVAQVQHSQPPLL